MRYSLFSVVLLIFVIILLYTGYRYLPRKRIFYLLTAIIIFSCSIILYYANLQSHQNIITEEQKIQILQEQPVFMTWYESYKALLEENDRTWVKYNNLVENFNGGTISLIKFQTDIAKNKNDAEGIYKKLQPELPPQDLSDINYKLCYDILEKTRSYVAAQISVQQRTAELINGQDFAGQAPSQQQEELNNIYILNAPVNLNVAQEIATIRDNLSLPNL